jgi:hypothetical protein
MDYKQRINTVRKKFKNMCKIRYLAISTNKKLRNIKKINRERREERQRKTN